jgi:dTDP-4-amino-4,6-dideoxygalactose transaminase
MAQRAAGEWTIPLAEPALGEEEVEAAVRVLRGGWLTAGPETARFEQEFAERVGVRHALALTNATAALHLAHLALGLGPGDEVVCPVLTFVASANAARYAGADVVFADVAGPGDLGVDPADVRRKIGRRTKAIVVVHYGGFACRMDAILAVAAERGIAVIEDCAHAPLASHVGADGRPRRVGALGAAGCFSFFGNKNMTTGEGGMLTTDDDALAERVRRLRSHGMTTTSWDRYRGAALGYDVTLLGYNYRIDDVRSAIGRAQLAKLEGLNARRREVWRWYRDGLAALAGVTLPFADRDPEHAAPHILCLVAGEHEERIRRHLTDAGVQTSLHYTPIHRFAIHRGARGATPRADALRLISLPFGPGLAREQVDRVVALVAESLGAR